VLRNIQAVVELSDLVRTSFGPNGTFLPSKLSLISQQLMFALGVGQSQVETSCLINHLGKLFVTSDAATIIREIEVVHPAAKLPRDGLSKLKKLRSVHRSFRRDRLTGRSILCW